MAIEVEEYSMDDEESKENLRLITYRFSLGDTYLSCSCIADENLTSIFLSKLSSIYFNIMNGESFAVNLGDVSIMVYDKVECLARNVDVKPIDPDDLDIIVRYELADDDLAMDFVESICNYDEPEEDEEEEEDSDYVDTN